MCLQHLLIDYCTIFRKIHYKTLSQLKNSIKKLEKPANSSFTGKFLELIRFSWRVFQQLKLIFVGGTFFSHLDCARIFSFENKEVRFSWNPLGWTPLWENSQSFLHHWKHKSICFCHTFRTLRAKKKVKAFFWVSSSALLMTLWLVKCMINYWISWALMQNYQGGGEFEIFLVRSFQCGHSLCALF